MRIDRKVYDAVIDTGAQVSLMSRKVFDQMDASTYSTSEAVVLTGLNVEQKMKGELLKNVEFRVGDVKFKNDFYVSDIADDVLLGLDFLVRNNVTIDMSQSLMRLPKASIPFNLVRSGQKQYRTCRVEAKGTITVPPESVVQAVVTLKGNVDTAKEFLIPATYSRGLLIPNVVVQGAKEVVIEVVNPSKHFHHFKRDALLGVAEECDVYPEPSAGELHDVEYAPKARKALEDSRSSMSDREMPAHLKDLSQKSVKHLDTAQALKFREVLLEYEDVFSKDDFDIGCLKKSNAR